MQRRGGAGPDPGGTVMRQKMEWLRLCRRHAEQLALASEERRKSTQYPKGFNDPESRDMWRRRRIAEARAAIYRARAIRLGNR